MPVEQVEKNLFISENRRVDAEFRRIDSEIAGVKKSQEKFETRTEKAINDLRIDAGALRTEMNTRFDKVDEQANGNFKAMVTIYLTTTGIVLAAFYAFVSHLTK
ncbi:MAG: hypothetical protein LBS00_04355 [Synergistaceae bacterium]|jgi:hypothetical protein|nr:hypothetical protein [Synergistaceae bacterium]